MFCQSVFDSLIPTPALTAGDSGPSVGEVLFSLCPKEILVEGEPKVVVVMSVEAGGLNLIDDCYANAFRHNWETEPTMVLKVHLFLFSFMCLAHGVSLSLFSSKRNTCLKLILRAPTNKRNSSSSRLLSGPFKFFCSFFDPEGKHQRCQDVVDNSASTNDCETPKVF